MTISRLNPSTDGRAYYFGENQELLAYLRKMYPAFDIAESLSLLSWENVHHSHKLKVKFTGALSGITTEELKQLSAENPHIQLAIQDALIDYFDFVVEQMHSRKFTKVSVVVSSIQIEGVSINTKSYNPELKVFLKAVFIPK
ncbi:hypothetical protein Xoosp13_375 [Xanthomonas phage Xoo-sp13]|nr:hypothetical protein Xoosp13_375 [Xanthomonas phage Xoo-sp13]